MNYPFHYLMPFSAYHAVAQLPHIHHHLWFLAFPLPSCCSTLLRPLPALVKLLPAAVYEQLLVPYACAAHAGLACKRAARLAHRNRRCGCVFPQRFMVLRARGTPLPLRCTAPSPPLLPAVALLLLYAPQTRELTAAYAALPQFCLVSVSNVTGFLPAHAVGPFWCCRNAGYTPAAVFFGSATRNVGFYSRNCFCAVPPPLPPYGVDCAFYCHWNANRARSAGSGVTAACPALCAQRRLDYYHTWDGLLQRRAVFAIVDRVLGALPIATLPATAFCSLKPHCRFPAKHDALAGLPPAVWAPANAGRLPVPANHCSARLRLLRTNL